MYFWKTRLLAEDLKQNIVGEGQFKNYFLATAVLNVAVMYVPMSQPGTHMLTLVVQAFACLIVTVLGINAAFKVNGGVLGTRFMDKVVSLSFPLLIQMMVVVGVVVGMVEGIGALLGLESTYLEWAGAILVVVVQILFYWRLTKHIRYVNA